MSKLKELFPDWRYIKLCIYIVLTAILLYIAYLFIGNLNQIVQAALSVLSSLARAFSPLMIGLILSYLISPLVELIDNKLMAKLFFKQPTDPVKLEKQAGIRRTLSILVTFLLILFALCGIIYAFAVLIVGQLFFTSIQSMVDSIVNYFLKYESIISNWMMNLPTSGLEDQIQILANKGIAWFSRAFSTSSIITHLANFSGNLVNFVIGTVISIYLLKDKDFFIRLWRKTLHLLLPMKTRAKVSDALFSIHTVISQFLRGQVLDALIVAVLSSVGLSLIQLDFAVFLGCFAGLANFIPYFGPIISIIPAGLIGLLTGGVSQAILTVIVLVIVQQIDCNIIYPRVVGASTGLHPLFILISVTVGGFYWGILGMIIAVPIAAILKVFLMKKIENLP